MPPTPGVKVKLGGKQRVLRYDMESLDRLEDETGKTALEHVERLTVLSAKAINALVWAGLLHGNGNMTMADARSLIDLRDVKEIAEGIGKAITIAYGTEGEDEGGKAEPAT